MSKSTQQGRRTSLSLSGAATNPKPGQTNGKSVQGSPGGHGRQEHGRTVKQQFTAVTNSGHSRNESQKSNPAPVDKKSAKLEEKKTLDDSVTNEISTGSHNGIVLADAKITNENSENCSVDAAPTNGNAAAKKEKAPEKVEGSKSDAGKAKSNEHTVDEPKQQEQKASPKTPSTPSGSQTKKSSSRTPNKSTEPKTLNTLALKSPVEVVEAKPQDVEDNTPCSPAKPLDTEVPTLPLKPSNNILEDVPEDVVMLVETPTSSTDAQKTQKPAIKSTVPKSPPPKQAVVEDAEMESILMENSLKKSAYHDEEPVVIIPNQPAATSTPGKTLLKTHSKSEVQLAMQADSLPDRSSCPRTFGQISGRRSIRHEYIPAQFDSNMQFRESYRCINTELDVTANSNTSMDVTVGSEVPNNSSFSFFGRRRKRDLTPPGSQSAVGLQTDAVLSPPKRARLGVFFSAVASPLTTLRSRFAKSSIQSSTPVKLGVDDVQNVSGVSIEEDSSEGDVTVGKESCDQVDKGENITASVVQQMKDTDDKKPEDEDGSVATTTNINDAGNSVADEGDIVIRETPVSIGNKRCNVM